MRTRLGIAVLGLFAAVGLASAQGPKPRYHIEKDQVQQDGHSQDRLLVTRRADAQGKPTLYVTMQFKIIRDGQATNDVLPNEIRVFEDQRPVTNLEIHTPAALEPLTTVLAIDISGSMAEHGKMDAAKQAARVFLERLDPRSPCGLILFDHKLRVQERPTADRERLRRLIDDAEPSGGTAYLDATAEAVNMLRRVKGRKAVLLLTDGVDLNSRRSQQEVIRQARAADVPIYTIGVGEPGKNTPLTTVMVLDRSGSMDSPADDRDSITKMEALRRAAVRFVDIMRPGAQMTLLPFDHEVDKPKPFRANKEALKGDIRQLRVNPDGGTSLYDATLDAVETLVAGRLEGKKAVVVLTDGVDESPGSIHSFQEVIARAREEGIPLHMLGLGRDGEINEVVMRRMADQTGGTYHHARNEQTLFEIFENLSIQLHDDGVDEAALRKLADETGGKYYPAQDISQLQLIYAGLADELQTTYTVTFPSLRQDYDGTLRDINISAWRNGEPISDEQRYGYNVPGVVVPEMDAAVYLGLLVLLGGLLGLPAGLRRLGRRQA
jgi:VWFA-related protein